MRMQCGVTVGVGFVLLAGWAGCGDPSMTTSSPDGSPDAATPAADAGPGSGELSAPLFEAYRDLRAAVRASPDHVARRAADAVASGDAEVIFEFVRDEIIVYPAGDGTLGSLVDGARWGVAGTLRSGAGTPREQAELLAHLLREAGFTARVVRGDPAEARRDLRGVFLRSHQRTFAPTLADDAGQRWAASLGIDHPGTTPRQIDGDGARAAELASELVRLAEPWARPRTINWRAGALPLVEVEVAGEPLVVSPLYPDAGFEAFPTSAAVQPVDELELPRVNVTFWGRRTSAPDERIVLVDGSWSTDQLVGRRMSVKMTPAYDLPTLLAARLDEVELFLPMLALLDPDTDEAESLSRVGNLVTPTGHRIEVDASGQVWIDGRSVGDGAPAPALEAAVASAAIESIDARQFPEVTARLAVRDDDGDPIEGLPPASFEVREHGEVQTALMVQNRSDAPRVLLLLDASGSMPDALVGDDTVTLGLDLAREVQSRFPEASFRVASASVGADFHGPWTTSLTELEGQLGDLQSLASNLYTSLAEAMAAEPTLVLFMTDGEATDAPTEEIRNAIIAGARTVILAAGTYDDAVIDDLVALTGGAAVPVGAPGDVVAAAVDALEAERRAPYVFRYSAPEAGPDQRQVEVDVASLTAAGSYRVPAADERGPTGRWIGLHVTIEMGGETITRTIAGLPPDSSDIAGAETLGAEVEAAFFSSTVLSFEAAPPPPSVLFDDILTEKLTLEPLFAAADDADGLIAAIEDGFVRSVGVPALVQALPADLAASDHLTYETGLRVVATFERPHFDGPTTRQIDILPWRQTVTVSEDPAEAWRQNLAHTARAAIVEEASYATSTLSLLDGETLIAVPAEDADDVQGFDVDMRERWRRATAPHRGDHTVIMPADGAPLAFWIVNETTGAATAILPDGSGGGVTSDEEAELRRRIQYLEMLAKMLSMAGSPYAPWVKFYVAQAKIVAYISLIISNLGDPDFVPPSDLSPHEVLKGAACSLLDDGLLGALPGDFGDLLGDVANYYWLISGGEELLPSVCG